MSDISVADFAKTLKERLDSPAEDDTTDLPNPSTINDAAPVVNVTVSGMDEVVKKAMEDAQVAMKSDLS